VSASTVIASCLILASQTYSVPPAVLIGIYKAEGGKIGQEVHNTNGSYDLGPMQINTIWIPSLAKKWGVNEDTAKKWVRDDACTNVGVAAWILKGHLNETGSLSKAIAHYHSRTPRHGERYKKRVIEILTKNGLVQK
tara:strand:- start:2842 stop:3252 length:411 start_codon:yes stop_codon:yes gene_type:complete